MHNSGAMLADQEIYQRLASKLPDPKASNSLHVCLLCNAASADTPRIYRDIGMLADQEIEHRLASSVSGLRCGIASARTLHASLRSEAKSLEDFIPMLVEGARSGITSLLKHQARS